MSVGMPCTKTVSGPIPVSSYASLTLLTFAVGINMNAHLGVINLQLLESHAFDVKRRATSESLSSIWLHGVYVSAMCRNIKVLFNFEPPATPEEIRDASLQFVRKISGYSQPSKANEQSFWAAVDDITRSSTRLLSSLKTNSASRNREEEIAKSRIRARKRFGS